MNKTKKCSRVLTSIALIFCMLFGLVSVSNAGEYSNTLYPLGSNSRATRTVTPERHTIKIYISGGKNGSSLKKDVLPSWISVNTSNSDYYLATITPNTTTSDRSGSIVFTKGSNKYELYVTQKSFRLTNSSGAVVSSLNFKVAGESKSITASYACTRSGTIPNWLTVTQSGNTYTFKAQPNINGSIRKCTLTFTKTLSTYEKVSRTITIIQSANSITGVPESRSVSNKTTTFSFTVTTGYGTVLAQPGPTWIHVTQKGNTITVRVDANTLTDTPRTGYVVVRVGDITKKCNITQAKRDHVPGPTPVLPG